jgi:hypothetical protein
MYHFREFKVAGGLVSYGVDASDAYRLVGVYTGRVLKGDKTAELPVSSALQRLIGGSADSWRTRARGAYLTRIGHPCVLLLLCNCCGAKLAWRVLCVPLSPDEVPDDETAAFSRVARKRLPCAVTTCIGSIRDTDVACWLIQSWCSHHR